MDEINSLNFNFGNDKVDSIISNLFTEQTQIMKRTHEKVLNAISLVEDNVSDKVLLVEVFNLREQVENEKRLKENLAKSKKLLSNELKEEREKRKLAEIEVKKLEEITTDFKISFDARVAAKEYTFKAQIAKLSVDIYNLKNQNLSLNNKNQELINKNYYLSNELKQNLLLNKKLEESFVSKLDESINGRDKYLNETITQLNKAKQDLIENNENLKQENKSLAELVQKNNQQLNDLKTKLGIAYIELEAHKLSSRQEIEELNIKISQLNKDSIENSSNTGNFRGLDQGVNYKYYKNISTIDTPISNKQNKNNWSKRRKFN